jgi:polysaccharide export outer membrane protein
MRVARVGGGAAICAFVGLLALAGCNTIPADGPGGRDITHAGAPAHAGYVLINLDYRVAQAIASVPQKVSLGLADDSSDAPDNLIREGDTLAVSYFEPSGAQLFSANGSDATLSSSSSSGLQAFPPVVVDPDGYVDLPFAGKVSVAGATPDMARARIRAALRGRVIDPQVLVQVTSSSANSVSVLGEVRNVGRFRLTPNSDRLLDVVAEAGGPIVPAEDIVVEIVRGSHSVSGPMSQVMADPDQNIRLAPHDQIRLLSAERKFSVFGALGRVTQTPITDAHLSLAGAISRSGGLDTWTADDAYVFVFRFERPDVIAAQGLSGAITPKGVPVVYRLDMRNPAALLVADDLEIENGDLIYVPRAGLVAVNKFMQVVNAVAQATYSAKVTGAP